MEGHLFWQTYIDISQKSFTSIQPDEKLTYQAVTQGCTVTYFNNQLTPGFLQMPTRLLDVLLD
jgi:hypothetical protein